VSYGRFLTIVLCAAAAVCSGLGLLRWNMLTQHIMMNRTCANILMYARMPDACNTWHVHTVWVEGICGTILAAAVFVGWIALNWDDE
jgi:hypothetical protein